MNIVKKTILVAGIILALSFASKAQHTTSDVFNVSEINFYGLDFSNIRLIGSEGFTDPWDIKNRLFNSWNNLFISEPDKYNVAKTFYKSDVKTDLALVKERNQLPDPTKLVIDESYSFGEDVVKKIISEYDLEDVDGIGLVFIMESFNKNDQRGYMWVTFFDLTTKEVLFTEKFSGKASGFGIRNYWAKSYYNVMAEIEKKKWKSWASKY